MNWMRRLATAGVFFLMMGGLTAGSALARSVTLAWDANTEPDIAGYKVYYRSGSSAAPPFNGTGAAQGSSPVDVGKVTTVTIGGLADGETWHFAVTAYNSAGFESGFSESVSSPSPVVVNRPPVLSANGPKTVAEGSTLSFAISATDPDGDPLTYGASNLPTGAAFNASNRTFTWTPGYTQAGSYSVTFFVSDGKLIASETVSITVTDTNRPPVLSAGGAKSVNADSLLSFTVSGSDPDGDPLTFSAATLPSGAAFNPSNRTFTWTPNSTQVGSHKVTFNLSDGKLTASETVEITVNAVNRPPVLAPVGPKSVYAGSQLAFTVSGSDPDGDPLTFSAAHLPAGASFSASTRTFIWTPSVAQTGSYGVTFAVSDGKLTASELVAIVVQAPQSDPVADQWRVRSKANDGGYIVPSGELLLKTGTSQTFTLTPKKGFRIQELRVNGSSVGSVESYTLADIRADHTVDAVFTEVPQGLSFVPAERGIAGVDRTDGGDAHHNLVAGVPSAAVDFLFQVVYRDIASSPLKVFVILNGYAQEMSRSEGELETGAIFTYKTPLGPAPAHHFHFEVRDLWGNVLWELPERGELTGPKIELLAAENMVGIPGDSRTVNLNSAAALGTPHGFRWNSGGLGKKPGSYQRIDATGTVRPAEGYFLKRVGSALPDANLPEIESETFTLRLQPGWNLISNPYRGNIQLSRVQVQRGAATPVPWESAAWNGWIVNALYDYQDGKGAYGFQSVDAATDPVVIPWLGYWIYVNRDDADYSLVFPRPAR